MPPVELADELERLYDEVCNGKSADTMNDWLSCHVEEILSALRSQSQPDNSGGGGEDVTNAKAGESTTF